MICVVILFLDSSFLPSFLSSFHPSSVLLFDIFLKLKKSGTLYFQNILVYISEE